MADKIQRYCDKCFKDRFCCGETPKDVPQQSVGIDWSKPIQTRDGRKARRVGTLSGRGDYGKYPAICVITQKNGSEYVQTLTENGKVTDNNTHISDVINIPEKRVRARIYVKAGMESHLNNTDRSGEGRYSKRITQYGTSREFYSEMTEAEAKERGLDYDEI